MHSPVRKHKVHRRTGLEGPERAERYRFVLSLTSALDRDRCSSLRPDHFTAGKEIRYHLHMRLGEHQGWPGRVHKISRPPEFDPRTFKLLASRYTDCDTLAHIVWSGSNSNYF